MIVSQSPRRVIVFVTHRYINISRSAPSVQLFFRSIFVSEWGLRLPRYSLRM